MFKARNARIGNQEVKPGGANVQVDFRRFFHVGKLDLDGQGLVGARQRVRRRARHFFARLCLSDGSVEDAHVCSYVLKWRGQTLPRKGAGAEGGCVSAERGRRLC